MHWCGERERCPCWPYGLGVAILTYVWEPFMREVRTLTVTVPRQLTTLVVSQGHGVVVLVYGSLHRVTPTITGLLLPSPSDNQDIKHCRAVQPRSYIAAVDDGVERLANRVAREYTERRLRKLPKAELTGELDVRRKVKLNSSTGPSRATQLMM